MDKSYMLAAIQQRITQVEAEYRKYFDLDNGPSKSYSGASCMRSRLAKDLGTLKLLDTILMCCPNGMSLPDNEELIKAFDRLVEPRRHKK